jgi:glutaredoxin-related protein
MSRRAEVLADRCEMTIQAVIELIAGAPPDALNRSCEAEGWTAAVGAHIAMSQDFLIERVRRIVEDEQFPPFDATAFHEGNARAAEENAGLSSGQVIALLHNHGARATEYVRRLSDDDLDRRRPIPVMGDDPITAELFIERVLIGHAAAHLQSLRLCLSNSNPIPG